MGEEPPIIPPEDLEPEDLGPPGPVGGDEGAKPSRAVEGEEVREPEVPVVGDFKVTKVVRLPEDPDERRKIREEYEGHAHKARLGLTDAGQGRPAASQGRKGRGSKLSDQ